MNNRDDAEVSRSPFNGPTELGARHFNSGERESEAQFRELMGHLEQVFWMNNAADTAVLYVSPAYEKLWGRARTSLYDNSHPFLASVHPDDRDRMAGIMERKGEGGYDAEYRMVRPDGTARWIWARTYPVYDGQGGVSRYAGIAEDISERKWAEKERLRLAAIIEHAEDSIVSITLDGIIISWNNGAERKYGYTAEEVLGRSIFILMPEDHSQSYLETMKRVRKGETVTRYDTVRRRKDGTLINFSVGISPIESRDGEVVGVSKISLDLSRVRQLEAQLIEAQKMEVIGQLTGGVAHDFNNILAVILGYSELMMQELGVDGTLYKFAAAIRHAANRGTGLTRQLLVFSRKETVQFAVMELNDVMQETEGMLRQLVGADIEFVVDRGPALGRIMADGGYIGQVLMNLVANARDAMPTGGKLTVATRNVALDHAYAVEHPGVLAGDYVALSVTDTGLGMTEETKARLFDPFFTTKLRGLGTGLGLSTCQTIVQLSSGHIAVQSAVGKGTTIEVYFPRVATPADLATRLLQPGPMARGTETILVVEDDPEVRRLVGMVLQAQGYEVITAANGDEGLRRAMEDQKRVIRLVVSDVVMPGMGGQAMAGRLEAINPDLKFLFTSGYTNDAVALRGVIDPAIAFLAKPYTIAALARKVRDLLDAPVASAS